MQRNPHSSQNLDVKPGQQQYFDSSTGSSAVPQGYPMAESPLSQSHSSNTGPGGSFIAQQNHPTSGFPMSSLSGGTPSLTFTPSGSAATTVPVFRNIKKTLKALADNYENSVGANLHADAVFIQNYVTNLEKEQRATDNSGSGLTAERDEKPIAEQEVKPDAEVFALIQERAALDAFRQTLNQANWTSRNLPSTAGSHLDQDFELPQNMDNPTLNEVQQIAVDQIRFMNRNRKALADCIAGMAKAVEEPTKEEIAEFLDSQFHLQYNA